MLRRHIVLLIAIRPSDGDVKPGGPLGAFRERAGYEPAPGFTFSLPFIINHHHHHHHPLQHNHTTQLHIVTLTLTGSIPDVEEGVDFSSLLRVQNCGPLSLL